MPPEQMLLSDCGLCWMKWTVEQVAGAMASKGLARSIMWSHPWWLQWSCRRGRCTATWGGWPALCLLFRWWLLHLMLADTQQLVSSEGF